jgi:hypothetical protein
MEGEESNNMVIKFEIADSKDVESDEEEEGDNGEETIKICKFTRVSGSGIAYSKFIKQTMQSNAFKIYENSKL